MLDKESLDSMFATTIYRYRLDEIIRMLTVFMRMTDVKVGNVTKLFQERGQDMLSPSLEKGAIPPPLSALAFGRLDVLEVRRNVDESANKNVVRPTRKQVKIYHSKRR